MSLDGEGFPDGTQDPAGHTIGIEHVSEISEDDDELVAGEPSDHGWNLRRSRVCRANDRIALADAVVKPLGDRLKKPIARGVSERVVDPLEAVEVEEERRHDSIRASRSREGHAEMLDHEPSVRESGEGVVVREEQCPFLGFLQMEPICVLQMLDGQRRYAGSLGLIGNN